MEAIQNVETAQATEYTTTVDSCPTCISGTDPILKGLGVDILQDPE